MQYICELLNSLLLLGHTDSSSSSTGSFGMLTTNSKSIVVSNTTMCFDFSETSQVFSESHIEIVREQLGVFTISNVLLSVQKPFRNSILDRVLDNFNKFIDFLSCELTSTFVEIDICTFANLIGETATNTLDSSQGKDNSSSTIDVCVKNTSNKLEFS